MESAIRLCLAIFAILISQLCLANEIDPKVLRALEQMLPQVELNLLHTPSSSRAPAFIYRQNYRKSNPKFYPEKSWDDLYDKYLTTFDYKPTQADLDGLPKINSHSPTIINTTSGTKVDLQIQLDRNQESVMFAWIKDQNIICIHATCTIDSQGMNPGDHEIHAQVYNQYGGYRLTFVIKIAFRQGDKSKTNHKPDLVQATVLKPQLFYNQEYILARQGRGYSHMGEDIQVIDSLARALKGNENLRTNSGVILRFGKKNTYEHFLYGNSNATLAHKDQYLSILLQQGLIRSRNLSSQLSHWNIRVKGGIEIDGDPRSDIVAQLKIKKDNRILKLICLRGRCRATFPQALLDKKALTNESMIEKIMVKEGYLEKGDVSLTYHLLAGESLHIDTISKQLPYVSTANPKAVHALFNRTTPEYLNLETWPTIKPTERQLVFGAPIERRNYFMDDFQTLLKSVGFRGLSTCNLVKSYLSRSDPMVALEVLSQFPKNYFSQPAFQLLLASVYLNIQAFPEATSLVNEVIQSQTLTTPARTTEGIIYLAKQKYSDACQALAEADPEGPIERQRWLYYQGVCDYYRGQGISYYFQESLWQGTDAHYQEAANQFIDAKAKSDLYFLTGKIGLIRDSNPLNQGVDDPYLVFLETVPKATLGYQSHFKLKGRIPVEDVLASSYGISFNYTGFIDSQYQSAGSRMDFRVFMDNQVTIGKPKAMVLLQFNPFLTRMTKGGQSTLDGFGMDLGFSLPVFAWRPGFQFQNSQYLDPDPLTLNVMDPITNESAPTVELSGRSYFYDLTLTPLNSSRHRLNAFLGTLEHRKRSQTARTLTYTGKHLGADYTYQILADWRLLTSMSHQSRNYLNSDQETIEIISNSNVKTSDSTVILAKRDDTTLTADIRLTWLVHPNQGISFFVHSKSNQSSRQENSYSKLRLGLDYQIDL